MFDAQIGVDGIYNYKISVWAAGIVFWHLWQLKKPFNDGNE